MLILLPLTIPSNNIENAFEEVKPYAPRMQFDMGILDIWLLYYVVRNEQWYI